MHRRRVLRALAGTPALVACQRSAPEHVGRSVAAAGETRPVDAVLRVAKLGQPPWPTLDPFLFCVHHDDAYPAGNSRLGPAVDLLGRQIGNDFSSRDGWNMYHGRVVPGFPSHPHRGFETVTIVRRGLVDHSDSLGAAARYGHGDVQWLTAGKGIVHSEMFPLLEREAENPLELFQIWLNLPSADKFAEPHFSMFWSETVPRQVQRDAAGRATQLTAIAGRIGALTPPSPPPRSWAARPDSDVAIWTLKMEKHARFTLPASSLASRDAAAASTLRVNRALYFFRGAGLRVGQRELSRAELAELDPALPVTLENGGEEAELLVLQGRPIGEATVKHGPFVMTSQEEIRQAYADYRATAFGGWPWADSGPVHGGQDSGRFAKHANGRVEYAKRG